MTAALTSGFPTTTPPKWTERDEKNALSVKESMDAVHGFCGLMAGFEGFIINEYVQKNGKDDERLSSTFRWGLFLLIISFALNIAAALASFLWGVFLREGHYRLWFMTFIGRFVKMMATGAVLCFCTGVLLFIDTIGLSDGMLLAIYISSATLFAIILSAFLYTMIKIGKEDGPHPELYEAIMDKVNG